MSRIIKFRAWDKEKKQFWSCDTDFAISFNAKRIYHHDSCHLGDHINEINVKWTLQQYTGIKDKNGKEVYEGDIVASQTYSWNENTKKYDIFDEQHIKGEVKQGEYNISSYDMGGGRETIMTGWLMGDEPLTNGIKVVGNIYENKETT